MQWMAEEILQFAETVDPLRKILEKAYAKSGKRTKRSVQNIMMRRLSWGPVQVTAFNSPKDTLHGVVNLSHPHKPRLPVCIQTHPIASGEP